MSAVRAEGTGCEHCCILSMKRLDHRVLLIVFIACAAGPLSVAAKPKPSPTPTPAPTATPLPTATPTPTPQPTATPVPTATPTPTPITTTSKKCPLPDNYLLTTNNVQSPEQPGPLAAVCHNKKILCLPPKAYNAHIQHGDQPLGPCTTVGNNGPCP
jgi:hypothetical protein